METPICLECRRLMKCVKTGEYILLTTAEPDLGGNISQRPYQVWAGDTYECGCGFRVVTGFAGRPVTTRHCDDFARTVERLKPTEVPS